jgi:hypothetical protein
MCRLTWPDLIVDGISPDQFMDWIAPWAGISQGRVAPVFLNKFGSWFLRRPEGTVEQLDVFTGRLDTVAAIYEEFVREVNERWWQEVYLLSELVHALHQTGKVPGPGQCYALAPHPALGGPNPANGESVDPRFVLVVDMVVWQRLCAEALGRASG